jgi:hypothetical protein
MYSAVARFGLAGGLWLQAGLLVVLTAVVLLVRTEAGGGRRRTQPGQLPVLERLRTALSSRAAVLGMVLAPLVLFADVMTGATTGEFLVGRLHWDVAEIARVFAPYAMVTKLVGFATAMAVADRLGHRRVAAVGTVALGATFFAWGVLESLWEIKPAVYALTLVQQLATPLLVVGLHALFMDLTDPRVRATNFVVFMALLNAPRVLAPTVGAALVGMLDFAGMFMVAGVLQAAVVLLVLAVRPADHGAQEPGGPG